MYLTFFVNKLLWKGISMWLVTTHVPLILLVTQVIGSLLEMWLSTFAVPSNWPLAWNEILCDQLCPVPPKGCSQLFPWRQIASGSICVHYFFRGYYVMSLFFEGVLLSECNQCYCHGEETERFQVLFSVQKALEYEHALAVDGPQGIIQL